VTGSILLSDINNSGAIYQWSTGETANSIAVNEPGIYWVAATTPGSNCQSIDSIEVRSNCYINIPNAFSPDGDGMNDYFIPRELLSSGVTKFSMQLFNRWGEMIYSTEQLDGRGWDGRYNGKPQPMGVYVYHIDATFLNGYRKVYTGNVTLVR
jgi:hypothetical protein